MLGRLGRELPGDGYLYEPKWDGFRCLAFRSGDELDMRSRNDRPLARYFPEISEPLRSLSERNFVLDGELVVAIEGRFDFAALMARLHPAASRVERLRVDTPSSFIAFDLPAVGDLDLRKEPFERRRQVLEGLLGDIDPPLFMTPITDDRAIAEGWLDRFHGTGADGVIAKRRDLPYTPGARTMVKVKRERTADCVVAGFRWFEARPVLSSLLLGLYDAGGELQHVGVATQFTEARRAEILEELRSLAVPVDEHPWRHGFLTSGNPMGRLKGAAGSWRPEEMALDWVPLAPERVCEVAYDHVDDGRFRHPARFRHWRPDRDARSCAFEQLEAGEPSGLEQVLAFE
jgi:ATP-dependent DNA ligase